MAFFKMSILTIKENTITVTNPQYCILIWGNEYQEKMDNVYGKSHKKVTYLTV